jgi:WD repeat-containing protein 48
VRYLRSSQVNALTDSTTRLSASRILRAKKIMAFIFDKLELGHARARASSIHSAHSRISALANLKISNPLSSHGHSHSPPLAGQPTLTEHSPGHHVGSEGSAEDTIELVCGDHVVDPKMTLATLKQYYGSGGDMLLFYRPKKGVALA